MEDGRTLEEELSQEHGLFFSILFIVCVFFGIFIGFFVSWFNLIYIALHKVSYPVWRRLHVCRFACLHLRDTYTYISPAKNFGRNPSVQGFLVTLCRYYFRRIRTVFSVLKWTWCGHYSSPLPRPWYFPAWPVLVSTNYRCLLLFVGVAW